MEVRFERIAQLIAIAAVSDKSISEYYVKPQELIVRFSEYVKSQIHMNVTYGLMGRSLSEYVDTLNFLNGSVLRRSTAECVLGYFYSDLSNFLINNEYNIDLKMKVDTDLFGFPRKFIKLSDLHEEALTSFRRVQEGSLSIEDWEFSKAFDYAKDAEDFEKKAGDYAFALKLAEAVNHDVVLESE